MEQYEALAELLVVQLEHEEQSDVEQLLELENVEWDELEEHEGVEKSLVEQENVEQEYGEDYEYYDEAVGELGGVQMELELCERTS